MYVTSGIEELQNEDTQNEVQRSPIKGPRPSSNKVDANQVTRQQQKLKILKFRSANITLKTSSLGPQNEKTKTHFYHS